MNERDIFLAAMELPTSAERHAFLDQACAGDKLLRTRVESLLRAHADSSSFPVESALEQLAAPSASISPSDTEALSKLPQGDVSMDEQPAKPGPVRSPAGDATEYFSPHDPDGRLSRILSPSTAPGSLGRLGHYEVQEILGSGGFGTVLRAFDDKLHRMVAIKLMSPELAVTSPARKRFLREARASAAIRHDYVVNIHGVEEEPLPYLVMEYIPGQTLEDKLNQHGPLELEEVLRLGQQIALGLAAAHAIKLVHRDIKPANILLESGVEERVKITDFGLARAADDASITQSGVIAGTPMYMAPEQALGQALDQRADLFSLGSVLYQMVCGRPPFRAETTLAVLKRVTEVTPRPIQEIIPEAPTWLCAIISKLHAKKPEDRFQSAKELADLLGQCRKSLEQHVEPKLPWMVPAEPVLAEAPSPVTEAVSRNSSSASTSAANVVEPLRDSKMTGHGVLGLHFRKASLIAACLLLIVVGLGLTEATGVTRLAATVIRLATGEGTLVIETDDPELNIEVDGKDLSIKGAGVQELKFRPGSYKVTARKDGVPVKQELVQITRGGREVLRVTLEGGNSTAQTNQSAGLDNQSETSADSDRKAAEYALSIGGTVKVKVRDSNEIAISSVEKLPLQPFRLTVLKMQNNRKLSDAGLAVFDGCKNLEVLQLDDTSIGDAGLARFQECKNLKFLNLSDCRHLTDAGLSHFQGCKSLEVLMLSRTAISDVGLSNFQGCTNLTVLLLQQTQVTDTGLSYFKDCRNLSSLNVGGKFITDVGLAHFQNCSHLSHLLIEKSDRVTDAGLAHFKDCRNLNELKLTSVSISEAGLANFQGCRELRELWLNDLQVTDAGLAHFKTCTKLKSLSLRNALVTDAGLAHVANCTNITNLELRGTKVTNAGLAHFASGTNLKDVGLSSTSVNESVLPHFRASRNIETFRFENSQISDEGLALFQDWKNLKTLQLRDTKVSDAGLPHLKECKGLTSLVLQKTQATASGIEELRKSLPLCRIEWDGGVIEPASSIQSARTAVATLLKKGFRVHLGNIATGELRELKSAEDLNDHGRLSLHPAENSEQNPYTDVAVLDALRGIPATFTGSLIHVSYPLSGDQLGVLAEIPVVRSVGNLYLQNTGLKDADLEHLSKLSHVTGLYLDGNPELSDVGLATIARIPTLIDLHSGPCKFTGKGLAALCEKPFSVLLFQGVVGIDDAAVEHLSAMPTLKLVYLKGTKISAAGVKQLSAGLPKCQIEWDGGVIEPRPASDSDRKVAEWLLSIGAQFQYRENGELRLIKSGNPLPAAEFHIEVIGLADNQRLANGDLELLVGLSDLQQVYLGNTAITDDGLEHLRRVPRLKLLYLPTHITDAGLVKLQAAPSLYNLTISSTKVTDAGLAALLEYQGLTDLDISHTAISDAGLKTLARSKQLAALYLQSTKITDRGLKDIAAMQQLTGLNVGHNAITDEGLDSLRQLAKLAHLNLDGTGITDAGLGNLRDLPLLLTLDVRETKVSEAGVKKLSSELPKCKIYWDGGVIEPRPTDSVDSRQ